MKDELWEKHQINITSEPQSTIVFENGYKIEKYSLRADEINIPFNSSINPGIHFK